MGEKRKIIGFFNNKNDSLIGYFKSNFDLTNDINYANKFKDVTDLEIIAETLIERTYRDWDDITQSYAKHTFSHLYDDWFNNIDKENATYKIFIFEDEIRRLKLNKLKNKKQ